MEDKLNKIKELRAFQDLTRFIYPIPELVKMQQDREELRILLER